MSLKINDQAFLNFPDKGTVPDDMLIDVPMRMGTYRQIVSSLKSQEEVKPITKGKCPPFKSNYTTFPFAVGDIIRRISGIKRFTIISIIGDAVTYRASTGGNFYHKKEYINKHFVKVN